MKRRGFLKGLALTPAAQAALNAQQAATPAPAAAAARGSYNPPLLKVTGADTTAETRQHFFHAEQFAALEKLGSILVPPLKGNPGAIDAKAPEFLDFLVSVSPPDRQKLYQNGLDYLNTQAKRKFSKGFAELDAKQADSIVRPLLTVRLWTEDRPSDPHQDFLARVHDDLRTATMNSREWAEAAAKSGRRFTRGVSARPYWLPIDPIVGD